MMVLESISKKSFAESLFQMENIRPPGKILNWDLKLVAKRHLAVFWSKRKITNANCNRTINTGKGDAHKIIKRIGVAS